MKEIKDFKVTLIDYEGMEAYQITGTYKGLPIRPTLSKGAIYDSYYDTLEHNGIGESDMPIDEFIYEVVMMRVKNELESKN